MESVGFSKYEVLEAGKKVFYTLVSSHQPLKSSYFKVLFVAPCSILGQAKRNLRLICNRSGIPGKILVDPSNLKFDNMITHL